METDKLIRENEELRWAIRFALIQLTAPVEPHNIENARKLLKAAIR